MDASGFRPEGTIATRSIGPNRAESLKVRIVGYMVSHPSQIGVGILCFIIIGFAFWPSRKKGEVAKEQDISPAIVHIHNHAGKKREKEAVTPTNKDAALFTEQSRKAEADKVKQEKAEVEAKEKADAEAKGTT